MSSLVGIDVNLFILETEKQKGSPHVLVPDKAQVHGRRTALLAHSQRPLPPLYADIGLQARLLGNCPFGKCEERAAFLEHLCEHVAIHLKMWWAT